MGLQLSVAVSNIVNFSTRRYSSLFSETGMLKIGGIITNKIANLLFRQSHLGGHCNSNSHHFLIGRQTAKFLTNFSSLVCGALSGTNKYQWIITANQAG